MPLPDVVRDPFCALNVIPTYSRWLEVANFRNDCDGHMQSKGDITITQSIFLQSIDPRSVRLTLNGYLIPQFGKGIDRMNDPRQLQIDIASWPHHHTTSRQNPILEYRRRATWP